MTALLQSRARSAESRLHRALSFILVQLMLLMSLPIMPASAQNAGLNLPRLGDADSDELSPASERRLGQVVMQELRRDDVVMEDTELTEWLNRFAAPLVLTRNAAGRDFEMFFVNDRSINAFALPGGFIGVHTGLILAAQSESELASVLAHEIGHVTQRHIARQFGQQRQTSAIVLASVLLAILAARANPDAAVGALQLGDAAARGKALAFSRDAEREADRVGLDMLSEAGFDPLGSVGFFQKLQSTTRTYESNAPSYLRTHPLTSERISDMQTRTLSVKAKQRADSLEFQLIRARLKASGDDSQDGYRNAIGGFEFDISSKPIKSTVFNDDPIAKVGVAYYGLSVAQMLARQFTQSAQSLAKAKERLPVNHPMLLQQQIRLAVQSNDAQAAVQIADQALRIHPNSRPLTVARLEALVQAKQWAKASTTVRDELQVRRSDAELWRIAAVVHNENKETGLAHRATAERMALQGAWIAAIEQLGFAQRAPNMDFVTSAIIDARRREFQEQAQRDKNDPINKK